MTLSADPAVSPGSRVSAVVCWAVIAAFVGFMFWSQARRARHASAVAAASDNAPNLPLRIAGPVTLAQTQLINLDQSPKSNERHDRLRQQLEENIQKMVASPLDKLKAVVMTRELMGIDPALRELESRSAELAPHPDLLTDAAALRSIYTQGTQSLDENAKAKLQAQLGWFGQLALTQGQAPDSPARVAILDAAKHSGLVLLGALGGVLAAAFLGLILLILLIVLFMLGKARARLHPASVADKPVFLESFALWCLLYPLLSLAMSRLKFTNSLLATELTVLAATLAIALWPLARGMSWPQLRQSLGWNTGAGLFTEMGAGVIGYLAGLPVIAIGFVATFIIAKHAHVDPSHPIENQLIGPMSVKKFLMLLTGASVAAPILEETVFRGALYFHLRRRWRPWLSAIVVAVLFAAIHPQGWAAIPVLGSIAVVLALLREWRGSLLASMTAHGINNGFALLLGVLLLH
jgi:membrane protease YdiL (CAAX protease family)